MRSRNIAAAALIAGATLLSLTACAPEAASSQGMQWINTDRGTVQCVITTSYATHKVTSCDWATLREGAVTDNADHYRGQYIATPRGRVFCLTNITYASHVQYDCDWRTAR